MKKLTIFLILAMLVTSVCFAADESGAPPGAPPGDVPARAYFAAVSHEPLTGPAFAQTSTPVIADQVIPAVITAQEKQEQPALYIINKADTSILIIGILLILVLVIQGLILYWIYPKGIEIVTDENPGNKSGTAPPGSTINV
jgi:hypothetical protein